MKALQTTARRDKMAYIDAKKIFPNYLAVQLPIPEKVWDALRIVTTIVWFGVAALLIVSPTFGLKLLWGFIVPIVPALVVVVPGLWRQICPMAFFNQLPHRMGFSKNLSLPDALQRQAFTIAVAVFVVVVSLRQPIFNKVGWATAALLVLAVVVAFVGGLYYKARSGYCGTFCPLGPIQRAYGQAPMVNIPQTYCVSCVGCQKNCFDFNPTASAFDDIYDDDPQYAGQRRLFMAMIPGFVLAYFVQGRDPQYSYAIYLTYMLAAPLASVGLYYFVTNFMRVDPQRTAMIFAGIAVVCFYWFAGPMIVNTVFGEFLGMKSPTLWISASRMIGFIIAGGFVMFGESNATIYDAAKEAAIAAAKANPRVMGGFEVQDVGQATPFIAQDGQTLLDVLVANGLEINASCKSGLCGSDAVIVTEGEENLSPPTDEELATLKRLGLEGKARLACSCRVLGPLSFDRNIGNLAKGNAGEGTASKGSRQDRLSLALRTGSGAQQSQVRVDRAELAGVRRVVIVGNGIAGVTAADELRKASPSVQISLLSVEAHHFYNRMALNKIVDSHRGVDGLLLQPADWYVENNIDVMLNTRAVSIDRGDRFVMLDNGQALPYDKLILATGASAATPQPAFLARRNCFVLRAAADAEAIRDYIAANGVKHCAVIGSGVLGIEAAECFHHMGVKTTLLSHGRDLMGRNLDEESALLLKRHFERLGLEVLTSAEIADYVGEDRMERLVLRNGNEVNAEVFVACIGNRPNIDLAQECGLETKYGIVVNGLMMSSDQNIFAIGDVAEIPGSGTGLWQYGISQAHTAVSALLGEGTRYVEPRPIMRLKSDTLDLRIFGSLHPQDNDEIMTSPPFGGAWWRVVVRKDQIVGAVHFSPPGQVPSPIWKLVQANADVSPFKEDLRQGRLEKLKTASVG